MLRGFENGTSAEVASPEYRAACELVKTVEEGFYSLDSPLQIALHKLDDGDLYLEITNGMLRAIKATTDLYKDKLKIDPATFSRATRDVMTPGYEDDRERP